ncbi:interphotoreceptor matrix proteoglycan 1-like [Cottoperca gobio]|uniref:Interphotoreceptor matrix proteoglycan 1-like n=1 Tax=Cottoperca gobio TaxID=56716 RepID=A0A6J2RNW1_COTGO|nr:interphotoreceptor matrix proteoglycan 1-like [Cottoperca gobio]
MDVGRIISIFVILIAHITTSSMTAGTTTTAPTTAAPTTAAPTTAAPTTVQPAAPTTAPPAAPTTITLIRSRLTFRSVRATFTSDLMNPMTAAYKARAAMLKEQITPVFQTAFPSTFKSLEIVLFSNGSVINKIDLSFASTFVPNITQIANTAISVVGLDIESSSIDVNGIRFTASSGVVSHKISLVTASCLVLLSWLLSSQQ